MTLNIGNIDNFEESLLIPITYDYYFDKDTIIGGGFKKRKNDYLFYLLDYNSCPVTYTSIKALLDFKGNFKIFEKHTYYQNEGCYLDYKNATQPVINANLLARKPNTFLTSKPRRK